MKRELISMCKISRFRFLKVTFPSNAIQRLACHRIITQLCAASSVMPRTMSAVYLRLAKVLVTGRSLAIRSTLQTAHNVMYSAKFL